MSEEVIDVRDIPPMQRHSLILERFEKLRPGDRLVIVNDHEPLHLLYLMQHEREDFDPSSYAASEVEPGRWVAVFAKRTAPPTQRGDGVVLTSFDKVRHFDDHQFTPIPVYSKDSYRVLLVFLKPGQFIPVHTPHNDLVLLVVKGRGEVVAGDERSKVFPGSVVIVPANTKRGLKAETELEALHLVTPPPTDADHEEVEKKIEEGRFE